MTLSHSHNKLRYRKPWAFWLSITMVALLVLLIIARLSMPYAIKWSAVYWFESQQLQATVVDVDIFLLDGIFVLKGVSASNDEDKGFSLEHLVISWQWSPLNQNQVVIDKVDIGPLKLDITLYDNGDLLLGGISLPATNKSGQAAPPAAETGKPWDIKLHKFELSDIEVCIDELFSTRKPSRHTCVQLAELDWAGELALMASARATANSGTPVYLKGSLNLSRPGVCVKQYNPANELVLDYCAEIARLGWTGGITLNPPEDTPADIDLALYVEGSLDFDELNINNNILGRSLVSLRSLKVTNIRLNTPDELSIDKVELQQFTAIQRDKPASIDENHVFVFDEFKLSSLKLVEQNDIVIDAIEIIDAGAYLLIDKNGEADYQVWLPASKAPGDTDKTDSATPFNYAIGSFQFNSQKTFVYHDTSLKVPFKLDAHDIRLSLTGLNSKSPDTPSHLMLDVAVDRHGKLKLDTDIMPLASRPSFKGHGKISGFDLRLMSPMTKQYIGHNIRSGQIDTELTIDVNKGTINSNMALSLHQLELKTLNKAEAERLNSEFGFPLNSSLSLLRDRDNTIRLDIPVTGDIDNPEFDPRDAIVKATSKAISTAVLHYYTPFGLVFAADALFNLATALNFEPVLFVAGASALTDDHKQQLDKLAALMHERPGIHLTLCGLSNKSDNLILFPPPPPEETRKKEQATEPVPVTIEQQHKLKQLAESRSMVIKSYLVEQQSIDASRLIECSPEYIETDISGAEISI